MGHAPRWCSHVRYSASAEVLTLLQPWSGLLQYHPVAHPRLLHNDRWLLTRFVSCERPSLSLHGEASEVLCLHSEQVGRVLGTTRHRRSQ